MAINLSRNSHQEPANLGLRRRSEFDDLQPELGDFSLEMDDLLFAVLALPPPDLSGDLHMDRAAN